ARHGCRAASGVGASRHADGARAARLRAVHETHSARPEARRLWDRLARREHAEHGAVRATAGGVPAGSPSRRNTARVHRGGTSDVVVPMGGIGRLVLGLTRFGASAPYERIYEELGVTVDRVV